MEKDIDDDEQRRRILDLGQRLTREQCAYLKSIARYDYMYAPEGVQPLLELDLIVRFGQLLVATEIGRQVANLCCS